MTTSPAVGTRVVGSLRSADGRGIVRIEDVYETDLDDLWSALTEPPRLAHWIGEVDGDLRPGGGFRARFTSTWKGPGRVDVCEPPRRLLVTMRPGEEDETVIEARLSADGERTVLAIEQRGLPLAELAGRGAGWQAHCESLAAHLAGREPNDWRARWLELTPPYEDLAGSPLWQAERASLMNFLQAQRRSVLAILNGLDDEALSRVIVPSGWTPLGIVEHLAYAERLWFQHVLTGQAGPLPWSDAVDAFATTHPVDDVLNFYRSQCAISDGGAGPHSSPGNALGRSAFPDRGRQGSPHHARRHPPHDRRDCAPRRASRPRTRADRREHRPGATLTDKHAPKRSVTPGL